MNAFTDWVLARPLLACKVLIDDDNECFTIAIVHAEIAAGPGGSRGFDLSAHALPGL